MKKTVKILFINMIIFCLLLVILETGLRLSGQKPVYRFDPGDKVKVHHHERVCPCLRQGTVRVYHSFYTDSDGIYRANPAYDFSADKDYPGKIVINAAGFRGNEFKYLDTEQTKVFFIGDSFTWGASANPLDRSFPDLVQKAGYYVYNGGIPGTDPLQYARVAEKYVPLIKPEVTVVCLFLGNDLQGYTYELKPNKDLQYATDIGFILGYDEKGNYFDNAEQALAHYKKIECGCCDNLWEEFLYKTVIGKTIYHLSHRESHLTPDPKRRWVLDSLENIRRVCRENGSEFMLFLIPPKALRKGRLPKNTLKFLKDFHFHYPTGLTKADFCHPPNNHFNTDGHRKFARFVLSELAARGFLPKKTDRDIRGESTGK